MNRCIQMLATAAVLLLTFNMEARAADVSYISGGVGADARQELLAKERDYNLKIIAADKSGDYLADVQVVIESVKKESRAGHHDGRADSAGQAGPGDIHDQGHI
jgi:hypothetical protein